jgi:hypothetical protein
VFDGVLDSKRGNDKEYPMEVSNDWERKIHDMSPDGMDSIHHAMRATGAKRPNVDFPSKYDKKEHKKIMEKERKEEKDRKYDRDRAEEMRKPKPKPEKRTWHNREEWQPPKGGTVKSLESIVDKAEESNFGAGQRGLGYGNEGHTVVQGSGQSHTISEIPPEMEIIVHDVNDIKESKKEGMAMFDTPNEVDNIMSEAQAEVDAQAKDTKRFNTGNPRASEMYKSLESIFKEDVVHHTPENWKPEYEEGTFTHNRKRMIDELEGDSPDQKSMRDEQGLDEFDNEQSKLPISPEPITPDFGSFDCSLSNSSRPCSSRILF